ncbi:MAG TPA: CBS domain-containing protein [Polyangiaceae bacterium]|nr:CBS domain-containing protein [Polyangiaceae bacterium]
MKWVSSQPISLFMADDKEERADTTEDADPSEDRPSLVEEVEPEPYSKPGSKPETALDRAHHPPPPPRLRSAEGRPIKVTGEPKLARELMTRQLFTIEPDAIIGSLEGQMDKLRFRHLPVVDGEKLVGLINHSDLLHASSSYLTSFAKEVDELVHKLPAKRIMRDDFVTVRPDATLVDVAEQMWKERVGCVLVTDEGGVLVGIITEGDFLRLAHHFLSR